MTPLSLESDRRGRFSSGILQVFPCAEEHQEIPGGALKFDAESGACQQSLHDPCERAVLLRDMADEMKKAGLETEDDVMALVKEVRDEAGE